MPEFQNLIEAFWFVREHPLEYLPEKSLSLFNAFWIGYEWRYEVEVKEYKGFELLDGFHEFMCEKFRVSSNRSSYAIAELYSRNQAEAFELWFVCAEEFVSQKNGTSALAKYYAERRDSNLFSSRKKIAFFDLLKTLTNRITAYVGKKSFTLTVSIINGWLRAAKDFDFEESKQEKTFKNFQRYIENRPFWLRADHADSNLPPTPSWDKIIWFRTAHAAMEEKALETFAEYIDEFAFRDKGFIKDVEFHWKNHLENQKDCHIVKAWKNS